MSKSKGSAGGGACDDGGMLLYDDVEFEEELLGFDDPRPTSKSQKVPLEDLAVGAEGVGAIIFGVNEGVAALLEAVPVDVCSRSSNPLKLPLGLIPPTPLDALGPRAEGPPNFSQKSPLSNCFFSLSSFSLFSLSRRLAR